MKSDLPQVQERQSTKFLNSKIKYWKLDYITLQSSYFLVFLAEGCPTSKLCSIVSLRIPNYIESRRSRNVQFCIYEIYIKKMNPITFILLSFLLTGVLGQEELIIECPNILFVNDLLFSHDLGCKDADDQIVECEIWIEGLPNFMELVGGRLSIIDKPFQDEIERLEIVARANGILVTKVVFLSINYYYYEEVSQRNTKETTSDSESTTTTNTGEDGSTTTQTVSRTTTNTKEVNEKNSSKVVEINATTLIPGEGGMSVLDGRDNEGDGNGSDDGSGEGSTQDEDNDEGNNSNNNNDSSSNNNNNNNNDSSTNDSNDSSNNSENSENNNSNNNIPSTGDDEQTERIIKLLNRQSRAHQMVIYFIHVLEIEQRKVIQAEEQKIESDQRISQIESSKKNINQQIQQGDRLIEQKEIVISMMRERLVKLSQDFENNRENLEREREMYQQKLIGEKRMSNQVEKVTDEIYSRFDQVIELETELDQEKRKCQSVQKELSTLNNENRGLLNEREKSQERVEEIQSQIDANTRRIAELLNQVQKIQFLNSALNTEKQREMALVQNIAARISANNRKIKQIEASCQLKKVDQLQKQISDLMSGIENLNSAKNELQSELRNLSQMIAQCKVNIDDYEQKSRVLERQVRDIEGQIEEQRLAMDELRSETNNLMQKSGQLDKEITDLENQIEKVINEVNVQYKSIEGELKNALIEKMLVDGLIKKIILAEHQIIESLGYEELFEKQADIPDDDSYHLLEYFQRELKQAENLYVSQISINNLQQESGEECSQSAIHYGIGTIISINGGAYTVEGEDGTVHELKVEQCSYILSMQENINPKIGDFICWRSHFTNNTFVIVESLLLES